MKNHILLIIIFGGLFIFDFQLGKYARGYQLFNEKLPWGFELKIDDDGEYKIVEEGFINIISKNQKLKLENGELINIEKLIKYASKDHMLFVYVKTNKGNKNIEILIDKEKAKGTQLVFSNIENSNHKINWINLEKDLSSLVILHFLFQILFFVFILKTLYNK